MLSNPQQNDRPSPDYTGLVEFLLAPLLEAPESLRIDCEKANSGQRVWLRLAFEASDMGRAYGRGGRNIQAIDTLLNTAATSAAQSLSLDIYDGEDNTPPKGMGRMTKRDSTRDGERYPEKNESKRDRPSLSDKPKPSLKEKIN